MSERYKKIQDIELKEQIIGCPVEIEKGAVLFDSKEQQCLLQLKFKNLSQRVINSVSVEVMCYDSSGRELNSEPIQYIYADLNAARKTCFGGGVAIMLKAASVENVEIKIVKVLKENHAVWQYDAVLERKTKTQEIIPRILFEELKREDPDSTYVKKYIPIDMGGDEWYCSCGRVNNFNACVRCGAEKQWIFEHANINKLKENLKNYISAQSKISSMLKEKEAELEQAKKSDKRNLFICGIIMAVLTLILVAVVGVPDIPDNFNFIIL